MNILQKFIRFLIKEKREGKDPSRLVALYPDENSLLDIIEYREKLKELYDFSGMRELEPNELHATVRWWRLSEGGENTKNISKNLEKMQFGAANADILEVKPLGDSLSLMLESESMQNIFSMVDQTLRSLGAPPSDYPAYLPHVALFYHDSFRDGFDPKIEIKPSFKITFDRINFVDGDDNVFLSKRLM